MAVELRARGIPFVRQPVVEVGYKGVAAGEQRVDLLVRGAVVVELKTVEDILPIHWLNSAPTSLLCVSNSVC